MSRPAPPSGSRRTTRNASARAFEIQTVFAWPVRDERLDIEKAEVRSGKQPLLSLQAANGGRISRLNKGLRRRREESILGFGIDPVTGRWMKAPGAEADDAPPDSPAAERIVPIVEDHKERGGTLSPWPRSTTATATAESPPGSRDAGRAANRSRSRGFGGAKA